MSTTEITVSTSDIAAAIALQLSPIVAEPTRFKPNHGKLLIRFGLPRSDKAGLALINAQLPGDFVAELELSLQELAANAEQALKTLAESLMEIHGAAIYRRNHERNLIGSAFTELKQRELT